MYLKLFFLSCVALFCCQCQGSAGADARRPNVILIMADDLGYQDLGCYGHPKIKTPVLDNMAKEGIRFTSFYTGATVCTPSRMALLTGAYPSRLGWTKGVVGYLMPPKKGLSPQALTMAEVFKSAGYRTGISGKWHLGDESQFLPMNQGFEDCYFIKRSNNQVDELWANDKRLEKPFNNRLLTEKFTNNAIKFIKKNKDKPFFLYLPYTAPHFPVEAHPDWAGRSTFREYGGLSKTKDYGDVVEELDHRIGQIFDTLKKEKLDDKTIVVFLSDNGPETKEAASANPFRGAKWSAQEGGTRVPCIIRYPGVISANQKSKAFVAAIDLLPSLSHACQIDFENVTKDLSYKVDGINVWSSFTGQNSSDTPRKDLLYWHGTGGLRAIRKGDWKLFMNPPTLYNLTQEDEEKVDLAKKHPEIVEQLQKLAKKRLKEINQNIIPLGSE